VASWQLLWHAGRDVGWFGFVLGLVAKAVVMLHQRCVLVQQCSSLFQMFHQSVQAAGQRDRFVPDLVCSLSKKGRAQRLALLQSQRCRSDACFELNNHV
jgi:hypothetical protein